MKFGLLSTYPPTQCGLATFTYALGDALDSLAGCSVFVVRSVEAPTAMSGEKVVRHLVAGDRLSQRRAADALNEADVAIVQHEYGIYGGPDGDELLTVLKQVDTPVIVVLHTVLARPTPRQREVLESVCSSADAVVVMSHAARTRLAHAYRVDASKVSVIPHGVSPTIARHSGLPRRHRILTWGLLGPGKGIEWGVEALARLKDLDPDPEYLVAGETHPKVVESQGESYREGLAELASDLGVRHLLRFDAAYRPTAALPSLIGSASVVLLPYDNDEQVTSGVLIEAVAAGRPVVATRFPHAVELLEGGAGITVPHRDPEAMADAIRRILTEPRRAAAMSGVGRVQAEQLVWPAVAKAYVSLGQRLHDASAARTRALGAPDISSGRR
ncbi:MAG TPA: glycosyltransferase [Propionibacteriaceae bacterium]|nr:glycosyltransferase [Propionibacteriaceae bacterium]